LFAADENRSYLVIERLTELSVADPQFFASREAVPWALPDQQPNPKLDCWHCNCSLSRIAISGGNFAAWSRLFASTFCLVYRKKNFFLFDIQKRRAQRGFMIFAPHCAS